VWLVVVWCVCVCVCVWWCVCVCVCVCGGGVMHARRDDQHTRRWDIQGENIPPTRAVRLIARIDAKADV
jgi:hypothetical protein